MVRRATRVTAIVAQEGVWITGSSAATLYDDRASLRRVTARARVGVIMGVDRSHSHGHTETGGLHWISCSLSSAQKSIVIEASLIHCSLLCPPRHRDQMGLTHQFPEV